MFWNKSRKRIKELEEEISILKSNWELDSEKLHGTNLVLKDFSRQQLVDWIIQIESSLEKTIEDNKILKSKLTRKKPIKKSEQ